MTVFLYLRKPEKTPSLKGCLSDLKEISPIGSSEPFSLEESAHQQIEAIGGTSRLKEN